MTAVAPAGITSAAPAITLDGVSKSLGGRRVLDAIDLAVGPGELVALLGPNGAGKTTFVDLVLGLRRPDHGVIRVFDQPAGSMGARRRVSCAPQDLSFPDTLQVRELVELAVDRYAGTVTVDDVLARFSISALARRQAGGLSGGQRRRLAVALALSGRPALALLDEPTVGLDVPARRALWDELRRQRRAGAALLVATHDLDEASVLASRVFVLVDGRIRRDTTPAALRAEVATSVVSFRGDAADDVAVAWPEVRVRRRVAERIELLTADADAVVRRLVRDDVPFCDLQVRPASLEDAFVAVVGEEP
jgi:ABC-2 type transport system ATP-binding protein